MIRNGNESSLGERNTKTVSDHEGHRKRLRERFERNGLSALHAHEIIELLLTFTIPRRDTKALAYLLCKRYQSLGALFSASAEDIAGVPGIGFNSASHLRLIGEVISHCLKERYNNRKLIVHRKDVEEYLRFSFGHRRDEYMAVLYLGNRNQVIDTSIVAEGTVNHCTVYPRSIIESALRYGATSIIVAHNHPGGGRLPSEADWCFTERLFEICRLMDIPLLDHLIISAQEVASLKEMTRWPAQGVKPSP
jgi:DNA repair protein RadC